MQLFVPPTIEPPNRPLGVFASLRAIRRNALNAIPAISFTQPILSGKTGYARWHIMQGPEGLKRVFLDNFENYPKSQVVIRMLRPAVGESLFTSEGKNWRWQRRAISPVFAARNIDALAPFMTATAERASKRIAQQSEKSEMSEMVREMISATFDVICDVALSGRDHFDADEYGAAVTEYFLTVGRASLLDFLDAPYWLPRPGEIRGHRAVKTMHKMVTSAIEERRQQGEQKHNDLLDYMLKAEDKETGRRMSEADLLHNMQFFIVAGHETTALTLAWALYLTANDKGVQQRARAEARAILKGRAANAEDIKKAPFIQQIIEETMRLYPPVGFLARKARDHDQLYDRKVKPKDTVFLNIYALHRHDDLWDNPNAFNPDNFSAEKVEARDRFQYLPFGAGPRICVGANFAMLQAQIILMTLLARFKFEPTGSPPVPVMHMTIRPDPGVFLKAELIKQV